MKDQNDKIKKQNNNVSSHEEIPEKCECDDKQKINDQTENDNSKKQNVKSRGSECNCQNLQNMTNKSPNTDTNAKSTNDKSFNMNHRNYESLLRDILTNEKEKNKSVEYQLPNSELLQVTDSAIRVTSPAQHIIGPKEAMIACLKCKMKGVRREVDFVFFCKNCDEYWLVFGSDSENDEESINQSIRPEREQKDIEEQKSEGSTLKGEKTKKEKESIVYTSSTLSIDEIQNSSKNAQDYQQSGRYNTGYLTLGVHEMTNSEKPDIKKQHIIEDSEQTRSSFISTNLTDKTQKKSSPENISSKKISDIETVASVNEKLKEIDINKKIESSRDSLTIHVPKAEPKVNDEKQNIKESGKSIHSVLTNSSKSSFDKQVSDSKAHSGENLERNKTPEIKDEKDKSTALENKSKNETVLNEENEKSQSKQDSSRIPASISSRYECEAQLGETASKIDQSLTEKQHSKSSLGSFQKDEKSASTTKEIESKLHAEPTESNKQISEKDKSEAKLSKTSSEVDEKSKSNKTVDKSLTKQEAADIDKSVQEKSQTKVSQTAEKNEKTNIDETKSKSQASTPAPGIQSTSKLDKNESKSDKPSIMTDESIMDKEETKAQKDKMASDIEKSVPPSEKSKSKPEGISGESEKNESAGQQSEAHSQKSSIHGSKSTLKSKSKSKSTISQQNNETLKEESISKQSPQNATSKVVPDKSKLTNKTSIIMPENITAGKTFSNPKQNASKSSAASNKENDKSFIASSKLNSSSDKKLKEAEKAHDKSVEDYLQSIHHKSETSKTIRTLSSDYTPKKSVKFDDSKTSFTKKPRTLFRHDMADDLRKIIAEEKLSRMKDACCICSNENSFYNCVCAENIASVTGSLHSLQHQSSSSKSKPSGLIEPERGSQILIDMVSKISEGNSEPKNVHSKEINQSVESSRKEKGAPDMEKENEEPGQKESINQTQREPEDITEEDFKSKTGKTQRAPLSIEDSSALFENDEFKSQYPSTHASYVAVLQSKVNSNRIMKESESKDRTSSNEEEKYIKSFEKGISNSMKSKFKDGKMRNESSSLKKSTIPTSKIDDYDTVIAENQEIFDEKSLNEHKKESLPQRENFSNDTFSKDVVDMSDGTLKSQINKGTSKDQKGATKLKESAISQEKESPKTINVRPEEKKEVGEAHTPIKSLEKIDERSISKESTKRAEKNTVTKTSTIESATSEVPRSERANSEMIPRYHMVKSKKRKKKTQNKMHFLFSRMTSSDELSERSEKVEGDGRVDQLIRFYERIIKKYEKKAKK